MPIIKLIEFEIVDYFAEMVLNVLRHRRFAEGVDWDKLCHELIIPENLREAVFDKVKSDPKVEIVAKP